MELKTGILLVSCATGSQIDADRPDRGAEHSDAKLDPVSLISKYSYPVQRYRISTEDGHILTLHRIPHGVHNSPMSKKKTKIKGVVILLHGLFFSALHWIITGTKKGLGYILADSGYDVWMPNFRGSTFSLRHSTYTLSSTKYWNFSWHEMGVYDLPTVIQYILTETRERQVTFIAHSQGASAFLVFSSLHPEYQKNIRAAFLLAPMAYMGHSKSVILKTLSKMHLPIKDLSSILGIDLITHQNEFLSKLVKTFCLSARLLSPALCENSLLFTTGLNLWQTNFTIMQIVLEGGLYGSSVKQLAHYAQLVKSNKFHKYDYGVNNSDVYGQKDPPEYDLKKVKIPVYVYYSSSDWLSDSKDVLRLITELPKVVYSHSVKNFSHIDHLFGKDVVQLEYEDLVEKLNKLY